MEQDIDATADETPVEGQEDVSPTDETTEDEFDRDRAMATIRKLRQEAKAAVKVIRERDALKAERAEAEKAKLSEDEQRTARIAELEKSLADQQRTHREQVNRYEVERQAARLGIVDPEAAVKLLDWDSLEYGDDGRPADVEDALQALIAAKPYLKASSPRQAVATTNGASRPTGPGAKPRYTSAQIADYDYYQRNKDDIDRAYGEHRIDP